MQDDLNVFSDVKPIEYRADGQQQTRKPDILREGHRYIARVLEQNVDKLSTKELARKTKLDRNTIRRVRRGERVHPKNTLETIESCCQLNPGRCVCNRSDPSPPL
jgi:ribosome-binding protein aMBF1 (putative translation factor)